MVQVTWSEPALQDLEEIHSFIARGSTHFARVTVERILEAVKRLTIFPQLGQVLAEKSLKRYREILAGNYRIIYREIDSSRVVIAAVIHASRDLPQLLEGREPDE